MRLLLFLFQSAYYLLYHQLAWTYDIVAAIVSLGQWNDWVQTVLPNLYGRVLEIGFGTGHFQVILNENRFESFGVDESRQMVRLANLHLRKKGFNSRLSRGYAQNLPFVGEIFDTVVATFPSEYIFDPKTLTEIWRVLVPAGNLVVVPIAWITGTRPLERLLAWLFRFTGEAPGKPGPVSVAAKDKLTRTGFIVQNQIIEMKGSQVLVIVARKQ